MYRKQRLILSSHREQKVHRVLAELWQQKQTTAMTTTLLSTTKIRILSATYLRTNNSLINLDVAKRNRFLRMPKSTTRKSYLERGSQGRITFPRSIRGRALQRATESLTHQHRCSSKRITPRSALSWRNRKI